MNHAKLETQPTLLLHTPSGGFEKGEDLQLIGADKADYKSD